ncbi:hypothetical protein [Legionella saoudiensis]|uniref:hypothetical protein n=1 Tax=Legionella saoudiensis TaxID=1750561 RepID=UPI0007304069|nr:hypothetical protein [Legionella saoudiensis]
MPYSNLPIELRQKIFTFFGSLEKGRCVNHEFQQFTYPSNPYYYINALKPEFQNRDENAKEVFLTRPEARREEYLFVDSLGQKYLFEDEMGKKILEKMLPTIQLDSKPERLNYLKSLYLKGAFGSGISLRFCLELHSNDLMFLLTLCTPHGLQILKEKLVQPHQLFFYVKDDKKFEIKDYGLLEPLFTEKGYVALKSRLIDINDVFSTNFIEPCQKLIDVVYSQIKNKAHTNPIYRTILEETEEINNSQALNNSLQLK